MGCSDYQCRFAVEAEGGLGTSHIVEAQMEASVRCDPELRISSI